MPQPSVVTYNELNGEEVATVLENRFRQFLGAVPYFQKHLTMPRVRIALEVKLEVWADQPHPDVISLTDKFSVIVEHDEPVDIFTGQSVDSTAPVAGGHPPDQVREMHGLPVSEPARGPRDVGGQIAIADRHVQLEGREVSEMPGLTVSRTGSGMIGNMPTSANAVVAKIDQGPAGLRQGQMNRDAWHFGGGKEK